MNRYNPARLLAATALMAFASLAQAQYMWIDEKGIKQFSDRPPPPSVPLKNILQAPKGMPSAANMPAEQVGETPATEAPRPKAAPALAERNAEFNKRQKDAEEREKKEQADRDEKAAKADNCERARDARRALDSGARIGTTDKNGERSVMSDEQRDAEIKHTDKVLTGCK
jgi:hypothetical protein